MKHLLEQRNVKQMSWKVRKDIFSEETEIIKTMYIKKELNYCYWQLIVDSCLPTLFSMYKRDLKIKCKNSNILSDKDFRLTNVEIFHKIMKILPNICFLVKLFTNFILQETLPFVFSSLQVSCWVWISYSRHYYT